MERSRFAYGWMGKVSEWLASRDSFLPCGRSRNGNCVPSGEIENRITPLQIRPFWRPIKIRRKRNAPEEVSARFSSHRVT